MSWITRHWPTLVLAPLMLLVGYLYSTWSTGSAASVPQAIDVQRNTDLAEIAGRYMRLRGTVSSEQGEKIADAVVMASKAGVMEQSACREPDCTASKTFTEGQFSIDLTKIKAKQGDDITLLVVKPGFKPFSAPLVVDVRAMDVSVAPQSVRLSPTVPPPLTPGSPQ